jgi:hypothetical protein
VQHECHVIFILDIKIHPVLLNFISNHFGLEKGEIDSCKKFKRAILAFHGQSITEKSHLTQVQSSGYVNFIQLYDIIHWSIFASEFDEFEKLICHRSETHFPKVETLDTFIQNLWILLLSCLMVGEVQPESMQTPYCKPVKKILADYLINRAPPAALTWLNLYLENIRSKIFVTSEGHEGCRLNTASILDNIY